MCLALLIQRVLFSWCPPSSYNLLGDPLRGFDGDLQCRLSLHTIWLWGLYICSHLLSEEATLMQLDGALIYEYSKISSGINILFVCLFVCLFRLVVFSFTLGPWAM